MIYDDDIAWKDSEASQDTIIEDPEDKPVVTEIQDDTIIKWQPLSSSDSVKQNHNPVLLPNQSKEIPYSQSSVDLSVSEEFPITNPRNILPCQSDAYSSASRKHTSSLMTPNARQFIKQISLPITSDLSPPRKCATVHQTVDQGSPESLLFRNNEDLSPPRKGVTVQQTVSQSSPKSPLFQKTNDLSPPRRSKNSSDNINDSSEGKTDTFSFKYVLFVYATLIMDCAFKLISEKKHGFTEKFKFCRSKKKEKQKYWVIINCGNCGFISPK